jgi:predicted metal-binding protein
LPPTRDTATTLVCRSCGDTMQNLRSIPKLGVRREQLVFVCPSCKAVEAKELNGAEQARRDGCQSLPLLNPAPSAGQTLQNP